MNFPRFLRHPWAVSVLIHGALLAALAWGMAWQWQSAGGGGTVSVELWSAEPASVTEPVAALAPTDAPPAENASAALPAPNATPTPARNAPDVVMEQVSEKSSQQAKKATAQAEAKGSAKEAEGAKPAAKSAPPPQDLRHEKDIKRKQETEKLAEKQAEQAAQAQLEQQRIENAQRIAAMAKAAGGTAGVTVSANASNSASNAAPNSGSGKGFSSAYQDRISSHVRRYIAYSEPLAQSVGNPACVVEVRLASDGRITSRRVLTSSGVPEWDAAVLRALDKAAALPKDEEGRVPPLLELRFRPKI